jgi:hypothetical protein
VTRRAAIGASPARHSTITLTLDKYCHVDDEDMRDALEEDD